MLDTHVLICLHRWRWEESKTDDVSSDKTYSNDIYNKPKTWNFHMLDMYVSVHLNCRKTAGTSFYH